MGDVVTFTGATLLDVPPERILQDALEIDLEEVIVIGVTKDGDFVNLASMASRPDALWLLEQAKTDLFRPDDS